jgi:hypothetical protein
MSIGERHRSQDDLREEFIRVLSSREDAVDISYLLNNTSVEDRSEAKRVLRKMIDEGMISTSPGFKYKLSSSVSASV